MAISSRAAAGPSRSIFQAACRVIRRAADISASESATQFCTVCFSASVEPKAWRETARSQSMSKARRDWPSQRMQWWMRPGPRRAWARAKPSPSRPIRLATGTRTSRYSISAWLPNLP